MCKALDYSTWFSPPTSLVLYPVQFIMCLYPFRLLAEAECAGSPLVIVGPVPRHVSGTEVRISVHRNQ